MQIRDQLNLEDEEDDIPTQFVIPGLPSLSRSLGVGMGEAANPPREKLDRDIALYEKRAETYVNKIVGQARLKNSVELTIPDPLTFWLAQVICCEIDLLVITDYFQEDAGDYLTTLPTLAQDLLAVPATSVPSERLFSISGILSENRRSHITPKNLERRVLIKANPYL